MEGLHIFPYFRTEFQFSSICANDGYCITVITVRVITFTLSEPTHLPLKTISTATGSCKFTPEDFSCPLITPDATTYRKL